MICRHPSRTGPPLPGILLFVLVIPALARAQPVPTAAANVAVCDLSGSYRLRFHSNGAEGWWLRLKVAGKQAQVLADQSMLGLKAGPIPLAMDRDCTMVLTRHTKQAGHLRITLAVAADGKVTGQLKRSDKWHLDKAVTPIAGRRETGPRTEPACQHPGIYQLGLKFSPKQKWKIEGRPGGSRGRPNPAVECSYLASEDLVTVAIEPLGQELLVDEVHPDPPYEQSFGRGEVVRVGDCALRLSIAVTDFELQDGVLELDGDRITGTASKVKVDMFEDGTDGENLWSCHGRRIPIVGKRVADLP